MTTKEVANRLVELCRQGKHLEAINELYADNIVSIEPAGAPVERAEGKEAVRGKTEYFNSTTKEVHGGETSDPIVSDNHFAVYMSMDLTNTDDQRFQMNEIAVYQVEDGKIVQEQFFFNPAPVPSDN